MAAKKRKTTTDATKHKLPLPKGHPQQRPKRKRPAGSAPKVAPPPSDETCPQPRETGPWCHQIDNGCGSEVCLRTCGPAPDFRAIPCGEDVASTGGRPNELFRIQFQPKHQTAPDHLPPVMYTTPDMLPPDTTPFPWPVVLGGIGADNLVAIADWCRALPTRFRLWLAVRLTRLAGWVAPALLLILTACTEPLAPVQPAHHASQPLLTTHERPVPCLGGHWQPIVINGVTYWEYITRC